jgi:hypothetical protein
MENQRPKNERSKNEMEWKGREGKRREERLVNEEYKPVDNTTLETRIDTFNE